MQQGAAAVRSGICVPVKLRGEMRVRCPAGRFEGPEGNAIEHNEGGCDCFSTRVNRRARGSKAQMTRCNAAEATGKQPTVAQLWRLIPVAGGRWMLNAGRIIRLGIIETACLAVTVTKMQLP